MNCLLISNSGPSVGLELSTRFPASLDNLSTSIRERSGVAAVPWCLYDDGRSIKVLEGVAVVIVSVGQLRMGIDCYSNYLTNEGESMTLILYAQQVTACTTEPCPNTRVIPRYQINHHREHL